MTTTDRPDTIKSGVDADDFKVAMRQLAGAVSAVTTIHDGQACGLTATAVCSLSAEPARLLVCVNRAGRSYAALAASRVMCVNVLAISHALLAQQLAGMAPPPPNGWFAGDEWATGTHGAPVLRTALATFQCSISSIIDSGTHGIVIGDIQSVQTCAGAPPLLYGDGRFTTLAAIARAA